MLVASIVSAISLLAPQPIVMKFQIEKDSRSAIVYPGTGTTNRPLVFCFHGHGQNGNIARKLFEIDREWPEAIVVYPNGIPGVTDSQGQGGSTPGWQKDPGQVNDRDLKFYDAMLEEISSKYKVDRKRVYVCGFSNGARFTYVLWATRHNDFAAAAAFSSQTLSNDLYKSMLPLPAFCASGRQETGITPQMSAASFQKVLEINKSDVKHPKTVKGMKNFPATKGGVESVSWLHPLGHDVPENAGKFIVPFFKRHHL